MHACKPRPLCCMQRTRDTTMDLTASQLSNGEESFLQLCQDLVSYINKIMDPFCPQEERAVCSQVVTLFLINAHHPRGIAKYQTAFVPD